MVRTTPPTSITAWRELKWLPRNSWMLLSTGAVTTMGTGLTITSISASIRMRTAREETSIEMVGALRMGHHATAATPTPAIPVRRPQMRMERQSASQPCPGSQEAKSGVAARAK